MRELLIYFAIIALVAVIIAELFLLWVVIKHGGGNTLKTIPPERPKGVEPHTRGYKFDKLTTNPII